MPKNIKLLLTENVESLGIVGDVVSVRTGYARNFLLPRGMATTPSDDAIKAVAAKRADAEKQVARERAQREELSKKLQGIEVTLQRSCNDLGHLYASITQQDIAAALQDAGYPGVKPRDVRLNTNIKRIDAYDVHIKFDTDLDATIKLWVVADRKLDVDRRPEVEVDDHGEMIEKPAGSERDAKAEGKHARDDRPSRDDKRGEKPAKADKPARDDARPEAAAAAPEKPAKDKKDKGPKAPKGEKSDAAPAPKDDKSGWGKKAEVPTELLNLGAAGRRRRRD